MSTHKRTRVEQLVADAQAKVSWGRAIAKAGLAAKPAATALSNAQAQPKAGWAKVVARINARIRARTR